MPRTVISEAHVLDDSGRLVARVERHVTGGTGDYHLWDTATQQVEARSEPLVEQFAARLHHSTVISPSEPDELVYFGTFDEAVAKAEEYGAKVAAHASDVAAARDALKA